MPFQTCSCHEMGVVFSVWKFFIKSHGISISEEIDHSGASLKAVCLIPAPVCACVMCLQEVYLKSYASSVFITETKRRIISQSSLGLVSGRWLL